MLQTLRSYEILVVENNEVETEARDIAAEFGARYLLCSQIGLSAARNAGLRKSRTEFVAYIDDDASAEPDWLRNLLNAFENCRVMAAAGRIIYDSTDPGEESTPRSLSIVSPATSDWFEQTNFGGIGDGANMAFRRSALNFWPGFDQRLGRGAPICESEEHKAFFSIVDKGYSVAYTPCAIVRHPAIPPNLVHRLRPITMATAFFTLTMLENPKHLISSVRFMITALSRKGRSWNERGTKLFDVSVSRWRVYLAMLAGPLFYFLMWIRHPFQKHYGQAKFYKVVEPPAPIRASLPGQH